MYLHKCNCCGDTYKPGTRKKNKYTLKNTHTKKTNLYTNVPLDYDECRLLLATCRMLAECLPNACRLLLRDCRL